MYDPSKFANMAEYNILIYAIGLLFISECAIWLFALRGNRGSKKDSDGGTVWLIIISWCFSIMAGAFFRSQSVPKIIHNWLLPHFCYYIGIAFIVFGVIIRCTAVLTLKKAFTLFVQTRNDQHLIKTGMYRIVRNPAYTGSILSLLGVAFAYRHILGVLAVFIICLICYGIRIRVEERALKAQFQEEFQQYCIQTKYRLIPGIY